MRRLRQGAAVSLELWSGVSKGGGAGQVPGAVGKIPAGLPEDHLTLWDERGVGRPGSR